MNEEQLLERQRVLYLLFKKNIYIERERDLKQLTAATEEVSAGRLSPDELLSPLCSSKIPKMTVFCPSLLQLSVLLHPPDVCPAPTGSARCSVCLSVCLTTFALSYILGSQVWQQGFCQSCGRCEQRRPRPLSSDTPPSINLLLVSQLHELTSCRPELSVEHCETFLEPVKAFTHQATKNCSVAK